MSSEKQHINLGNYEEYFILYMDNELRADEKMMVESFLSAHPDLKAEMDILMGTKLSAEDISFTGKEELLSHNLKMEKINDSLLSYIDNEVHPWEKERIEQQLKTNKDYQLEYNILMQTKLDASEVIRHPNKKELYRQTEKVVSIKLWMKIAAAVVVILFATAFFFLRSGSSQHPGDTVNNAPKKQTTLPVIPKEAPVQNTPQNETIAQQQQVQVKKEENPDRKDIISKNNQPLNSIAQNSKNDIENNDVHEPVKKNIVVDAIDLEKKNHTIAYNPSTDDRINKIDVTNEIPVTYNIPEGNGSNDVADNNESSGKGLKGFLRKATRVIERRTGITAANDDNEILIASVAVKLK